MSKNRRKKSGMTVIKEPTADDRGDVRAFRKRMDNGRDILVVGTASKEAADIIGMRNEDIEANQRKHGYWHPDIRNAARELEIPPDHISKEPAEEIGKTSGRRRVFTVPALPWKDD